MATSESSPGSLYYAETSSISPYNPIGYNLFQPPTQHYNYPSNSTTAVDNNGIVMGLCDSPYSNLSINQINMSRLEGNEPFNMSKYDNGSNPHRQEREDPNSIKNGNGGTSESISWPPSGNDNIENLSNANNYASMHSLHHYHDPNASTNSSNSGLVQCVLDDCRNTTNQMVTSSGVDGDKRMAFCHDPNQDGSSINNYTYNDINSPIHPNASSAAAVTNNNEDHMDSNGQIANPEGQERHSSAISHTESASINPSDYNNPYAHHNGAGGGNGSNNHAVTSANVSGHLKNMVSSAIHQDEGAGNSSPMSNGGSNGNVGGNINAQGGAGTIPSINVNSSDWRSRSAHAPTAYHHHASHPQLPQSHNHSMVPLQQQPSHAPICYPPPHSQMVVDPHQAHSHSMNIRRIPIVVGSSPHLSANHNIAVSNHPSQTSLSGLNGNDMINNHVAISPSSILANSINSGPNGNSAGNGCGNNVPQSSTSAASLSSLINQSVFPGGGGYTSQVPPPSELHKPSVSMVTMASFSQQQNQFLAAATQQARNPNMSIQMMNNHRKSEYSCDDETFHDMSDLQNDDDDSSPKDDEYADEIDIYDQSQHGGMSCYNQKPSKRHWGTGRKKIEIKFIEKKLKRQITFSKRKAGMMKKIHELATLTGTQALLVLVSETGHVYSYSTSKLNHIVADEHKNVIKQALDNYDMTLHHHQS